MKTKYLNEIILKFILFLSLGQNFEELGHCLEAYTTPQCLAHNQSLPINNEDVLFWKHHTENQFLSRGHVQGTLTQIYNGNSEHAHFQIQMGLQSDETLEIIYNLSFGRLPNLQTGMKVEACGDYITSNSATGEYPASPDGGILHWVHINPKNKPNKVEAIQFKKQPHDSGYLMIDGIVYGN